MSVDLSVEPTCGDLCVGVLPNIAQSGGLKIVSVVVVNPGQPGSVNLLDSAVFLCVLHLYIVLENLITR